MRLSEEAERRESGDDGVYYYVGERLKSEGETERRAFVQGSGNA